LAEPRTLVLALYFAEDLGEQFGVDGCAGGVQIGAGVEASHNPVELAWPEVG
jgi:hypothetical protein